MTTEYCQKSRKSLCSRLFGSLIGGNRLNSCNRNQILIFLIWIDFYFLWSGQILFLMIQTDFTLFDLEIFYFFWCGQFLFFLIYTKFTFLYPDILYSSWARRILLFLIQINFALSDLHIFYFFCLPIQTDFTLSDPARQFSIRT